jgi:glycosyltransferase involved in cell wall biosynthesis
VTKRRIALVTSQLLGVELGGAGVGAATASLALALARMGHDVGVMYIKEKLPKPMDDAWAQRYGEAGVTFRHLAGPSRPVEPRRFARLRAVELALRDEPPDVVIAHEYGGPAYLAQQLRRLGLAFGETLFVTYCHGTGPWVKDVNRNVRIRPEMIAHARLEQAAVELADTVVSPSAYLLGWMRERGWNLPADSRVIPLVTDATAVGRAAARHSDGNGRAERLVYFGRLEERKGIRPFVAALNTLSPEVLEGVDVEFLGAASTWDPARVTAELSEPTRRALRGLSFETELDREQVLARLKRPGTLAVMPSLAENSPNVVYECLEEGIPFLASAAGGIGELVAPEDRATVLFEPTTDGVASALRRALTDGRVLRPVRPAFDASDVLDAWSDVVATKAAPAASAPERPSVDVVVREDRPALEAQSYEHVNVIRAATRADGLQAGTAEWIVFVDGGDVADPELVDVLVRAQAASGADVVTCAIRRGEAEHFFVGEPGAAGLLENGYGTVALLRRSLLDDVRANDWPLLARLNARGARIVSVPLPLVGQAAPPATIEDAPADALLVADAFEAALPQQLRLLARLAAGLAADRRALPAAPQEPGLTRRVKSLGRRLVGSKTGGDARGAAKRNG